MLAKLKALYSPDIEELESFQPKDDENFGFLLQLLIGPAESDGKESFDVIVCTPKWLSAKYGHEPIRLLSNHVMVARYDFNQLRDALSRLIGKYHAESWPRLAQKLTRLGHWEFEDYSE